MAKYNYPWAGRLGRVADCCIYCGDDGQSFKLSSAGCSCLKCNQTQQPIPELEKKFKENLERLARKWCKEHGIDYDATVANYDKLESGLPSTKVADAVVHIGYQGSMQDQAHDWLIDCIYDTVEQHANFAGSGAWGSIDGMFERVKIEETSIHYSLALLTATLSMKSQLRKREQFLKDLKAAAKWYGLDEPGLFDGLD